MTRDELLAALRKLQGEGGDREANHEEADAALLEFINDKEITEAFDAIEKWYA